MNDAMKVVRLLSAWQKTNPAWNTPYYVKYLSNSGSVTNLVSHVQPDVEAHNADSNLYTPNRPRRVARTLDEFKEQMKLMPIQPSNPRFLRVAVLGDPNSGKSTLVNKLTNWRVCSVSSKVHTTRRNSSTVLNVGDTQIEFTDTPGTLSFEQSVKDRVESSLVYDPLKSSNQADILLILVDAGNGYTRLHLSPEIKEILNKHNAKPSILVLNKTDLVPDKSKLLEVARLLCNGVLNGQPYGEKDKLFLPNELKVQLFKKMENDSNQKQRKTLQKGWPKFSKMFMVSALQNEGVPSILTFLLDSAPPHPWKYHSSVVVKDSPQELAKRVVREKLLNTMKQELGYVLNLKINYWEVDDSEILKISMIINCPKKHLVKLVIGPAGKIISEISTSAQQELCNVFHCEVHLHLGVKYGPPLESK